MTHTNKGKTSTSNSINSVMQELPQIITSAPSIGHVYQRFTHEVKQLLDFDRAAINMINQESGTATLLYLFGQARPGYNSGGVKRLEGSQDQRIALTRTSLLRRDTIAAPEFPSDRDYVQSGLRANLTVPLISRSQFVGTMSLRSKEAGAYGPEEQAILELLVLHIVPIVENSLLQGKLQSIREESALVDQAAQVMTSATEMAEVYQEFAQAVKKLMDFNEGAITTQKTGSFSRLAGGLARDLGKSLSSILGHAELASMSLNPGDPADLDLAEIKRAAERAVNLTSQLLSFFQLRWEND